MTSTTTKPLAHLRGQVLVLAMVLFMSGGCRLVADYAAGPDSGVSSHDGSETDGLRPDMRGDGGPVEDVTSDGPERDAAGDDAPRPDGGPPPKDVGATDTLSPDLGPSRVTPCSGDWCWAHPPVATHTLRAIWARDANNLVAVGDEGTIIERNSGVWQTVGLEAGVSYRDVWGDGKGNVWAVGPKGVVLHRPAGIPAWYEEPLPVSLQNEALHALWGDANGAVWAAGEHVVLYRDTQGVWRYHGTLTGATIRDLAGDGTSIYAFMSDGVIYKGSTQTPTQAFAQQSQMHLANDLRRVFVASTGFFFAGGADGIARSSTNLASWSWRGANNDEEWRAVHGLPNGTNVWAVGGYKSGGATDVGGLLARHYSGAAWTTYPQTSDALYDAHSLPNDEVMVAGAGGVIARYNKANTSLPGVNKDTLQFIDACVLGTGEIALLTDSNSVWILDGNNDLLALAGKPAGPARRVWGKSRTDLWVVGSSGVEHYDGNNWTVKLGKPATDLWVDSSNNLWVTLASAGIYRTSLSQISFLPVANAPAGGYAAIGGQGSVVVAVMASGSVNRYQGGSWTNLLPVSNGVVVQRIAVASASTVYAVVRDKTSSKRSLLRYAGGWKAMTFQDVMDVWAGSASDVWVVTQTSGLWHHDGAQWTSAKPTSNALATIDGRNKTRVVAGTRSTVLRHQ